MNERFLEIDVRLLILRYGRQKVIQVLAKIGDGTVEELEQQLRNAESKRNLNRRSPKISLLDLAASECSRRPDIAEPLRALTIGFESRTFLPLLRDVQRFLDRGNTPQRKFRSRAAAGPALIRMLVNLTREDLLKIASELNSTGESDYALLARAIMRTSPTRPRVIDEREAKPPIG